MFSDEDLYKMDMYEKQVMQECTLKEIKEEVKEKVMEKFSEKTKEGIAVDFVDEVVDEVIAEFLENSKDLAWTIYKPDIPRFLYKRFSMEDISLIMGVGIGYVALCLGYETLFKMNVKNKNISVEKILWPEI